MPPSRVEFVVLGLLLVSAHSARGQAIGQGFELERAGQYQRAATVYLTTLRGEPTNVAALLGLERVLPSLNRLPDLLPVAQRAVATSPHNAALRALLLRTYVALNEPDSARAVAQRWATEQPRDETPYREWAIALEDAHRFGDARQVLLAGRRALGRPAAFGIELAELLERVGEWEGAAREWGAALTEAPTQLPNAASSLAEAPAEQRERIVRAVLATEPTPLERRLAGELLLGWGEPQRAWTVFEPTASDSSSDAAYALRRFADLASAGNTPDARRVRALALARYAELVPAPLALRARAEAARAFLGAGDRVAARQVLARVAAAVPGRGSVRGRPARGHRALRRAGAATAASRRSVPRAGKRAAAPRPRGLGPCGAGPAPCGRASGTGGGRGGRGGRQSIHPAHRRPGRGAHGWRAAADGARAVRRRGEVWGKERGSACGRARMGAAARASAEDRRGDRAPRAPDPRVSGERGGARGAPGAGAGEGSDSEVVKRRDFVRAVGRTAGLAVGSDLVRFRPSVRLSASPSLLIPMDDAQSDHLKAYGVAYRVVQAGIKAGWLLS